MVLLKASWCGIRYLAEDLFGETARWALPPRQRADPVNIRGPSLIDPLRSPLYGESLRLQETSATNKRAPSYAREGALRAPALVSAPARGGYAPLALLSVFLLKSILYGAFCMGAQGA
jgi:hypothetical protein